MSGTVGATIIRTNESIKKLSHPITFKPMTNLYRREEEEEEERNNFKIQWPTIPKQEADTVSRVHAGRVSSSRH